MKNSFLVLLLLPFVLIGQNKIINGSDASINDYPWQVAVVGSLGDGSYEVCGGSVIAEQWVITAAHCVFGNEINSTFIFAGNSSYFSQDGEQYFVEEYHIHPNYSNDNLEPELAYMSHDIALIKIQGSFDFNDQLQKINLISPQEVLLGSQGEGVTARLTGWGNTDNAGSTPSVLQTIELPIISNQSIIDLGYPTVSFDESMISVQNQNNQGPCFGDSGGPLIVRNYSDNNWMLAGVFSKTYSPCAQTNVPSTYISIHSVQPWLDDFFTFGCTDETAENYNSTIDLDDGSCIIEIPEIAGCTNQLAENFNSEANLEDGSCVFTTLQNGYCTEFSALQEFQNANVTAIDSVGDTIYFTGTFSGELDFGSFNLVSESSQDVFIVKILNCDVIWARRLTASSLSVSSLMATDEYVLIGGSFTSDLSFFEESTTYTIDHVGGNDGYLIKLNPNGDYLWDTRVFGMSNEGVTDIAIDANDHIYISGYYNGCCPSSSTATIQSQQGLTKTINVPNGNYGSGFVCKLDVYGNPQWAFEAWARDISISEIEVVDDYLYLAGNFRTWNSGQSAVINDVNGTSYDIFNPGIGLSVLAQYTTDGQHIWNVSIGNQGSGASGTTSINDLIISNSGLPILCGTYSNGSATFYSTDQNNLSLPEANGEDGFVTLYNNDGSPEWIRNISGAGSESPSSLSTSSEEAIIVGGSFNESLNDFNSNGGTDIFVFELNDQGEELTYNLYGSTDDDVLNDIMHYSNDVLFCGVLSSGADINEIVSQGGGFIYLPRYIIPGCTDPSDVNYNPQATSDDGSCSTSPITGCTSDWADNYNELATFDNGSCELAACPYSEFVEYNPNYTIIATEFCVTLAIEGCTNESDSNYNPQANTDDGSCISYSGCTSEWADNYDPTALLDDGSCELIACPDSAFLEYNQNYTIGNTELCLTQLFIEGCTNETAENYNPDANTDDGTCIINGCTLEIFPNYNPEANQDDLSCTFDIVVGCMDPFAFNYNAEVEFDNGTCIPVIFGCTDQAAFNYDAIANTDNDSCIAVVAGCTDATALNYNALANQEDGSCIAIVLGCTDVNYLEYEATANLDDGSCSSLIVEGCMDPLYLEYASLATSSNPELCITLIVLGCTDINAVNYNSLANVEDDSCVIVINGCTSDWADNYNPNANQDDGSCELTACPYPAFLEYNPNYTIEDPSLCLTSLTVLGCTNETAENYNADANTDDGTCMINGCTLEIFPNYNPEANQDDLSCTFDIVVGCMDPFAFNYNAEVEFDNGTCIPVIFGCIDQTAFNYDALANTDNDSCIAVLSGCTDATALNYNALANQEDGSCIAIVLGCTDVNYLEYEASANLNDGSCSSLIVEGCMDASYLEYASLATISNPSLCITLIVTGCTNVNALNYNASANVEDGSCVLLVNGCTSDWADNYNPNANQDDGSCELTACPYPNYLEYNPDYTVGNPALCITNLTVLGCTNDTADNYNPNANQDDGSCEYTQENCSVGYPINLETGWNLFGYSCTDSSEDLLELVAPIVDVIIIVKNNAGDAYLPEYNYNGIGNLNGGFGYQIKITSQVTDFNICE